MNKHLISIIKIAMLMCMAVLFAMPAQAAKFSRTTAHFEHSKTGFSLTGAHTNTRCESCHINGVFKGTPKQCGGCHIKSSRMGATPMPSGHMSTKYTCEACHVSAAWTPALFSHDGILESTPCASCHDGKHAQGKSGSHIVTQASDRKSVV